MSSSNLRDDQAGHTTQSPSLQDDDIREAGLVFDLAFEGNGHRYSERVLKASHADDATIPAVDLLPEYPHVADAVFPENHLRILLIHPTSPNASHYLPAPIETATLQLLCEVYGFTESHISLMKLGLSCFHRELKKFAHGELEGGGTELKTRDSGDQQANMLPAIIMQSEGNSSGAWSMNLVYQRSRKSTVAVIFGMADTHTRTLIDLLTGNPMSSHWLWVATTIFDVVGMAYAAELKVKDEELWYIEEGLGQRVSVRGVENIKKDYLDLFDANRSLNTIESNLALYKHTYHVHTSLLQRLQECAKDEQLSSIGGGEFASMSTRLDFNMFWYEGLEVRSAYLIGRAERQLQAVYSMLSQRDSALNLEIAQLSRDDNLANREIAVAAAKDSATMRVIAYVTLAFLPATFVATFFSTSFFDFRPSDANAHVSWWLWLYFVVSFPLTGAVLILWRFVYHQKEQELLAKIPLRDFPLIGEGIAKKAAWTSYGRQNWT